MVVIGTRQGMVVRKAHVPPVGGTQANMQVGQYMGMIHGFGQGIPDEETGHGSLFHFKGGILIVHILIAYPGDNHQALAQVELTHQVTGGQGLKSPVVVLHSVSPSIHTGALSHIHPPEPHLVHQVHTEGIIHIVYPAVVHEPFIGLIVIVPDILKIKIRFEGLGIVTDGDQPVAHLGIDGGYIVVVIFKVGLVIMPVLSPVLSSQLEIHIDIVAYPYRNLQVQVGDPLLFAIHTRCNLAVVAPLEFGCPGPCRSIHDRGITLQPDGIGHHFGEKGCLSRIGGPELVAVLILPFNGNLGDTRIQADDPDLLLVVQGVIQKQLVVFEVLQLEIPVLLGIQVVLVVDLIGIGVADHT